MCGIKVAIRICLADAKQNSQFADFTGYVRLRAVRQSILSKRTRNPFILVGIFFTLLYALAAPGSISELFSDSLEFQLAAPTFGIAHPTGYPLYTLLGGFWSRVVFPVGTWAWRMNLFSALIAAVTVSISGILAYRLTNSLPASLLATFCFALTPVWVEQATIAEVYTLHLLFVATILWICVELGSAELSIANYESPNTLHKRATLHLCTLAALLGLSLAHHRTTLLLLPGIALYLWWVARWIFRPQKAWAWWAIGFLSPLLLYLYIPIRSAMGIVDLNRSYVNSWSGFWRHVLASGYTNFLKSNSLGEGRTITQWVDLFSVQMTWWVWIVALIGAIGWMIAPRLTPDRRPWLLIALTLLSNLLFALNYQVADVEVFLLPVFFCVALFFGLGVQWLISFATQNQVVQGTLVAALGLLLIATFDWPAFFDRRSDWSVHNDAVTLAKTPFLLNSRVIGLEGELTALKYMQQFAGLGLAAQPVVADRDEARREALTTAMAAGVPTYLTRELSGIEAQYSFSGDGVLVRVWPRGHSQSMPPQHNLDVELADGALKLIGYDLERWEQADRPVWQLVLHWQPQRQINQTLKLSLRWLDRAGALLPYSALEPGQDAFPLRQVASTTTWLVGEIVRDVHLVTLPAQGDAPHTLQVLVYDAQNGAEVGQWQVDLPK